MLPMFAAYRSSVTQTDEVLINKCLVFGKSISTQTDYTVPYHVTVATQTPKHHINPDQESVFNHEMITNGEMMRDDNVVQNEEYSSDLSKIERKPDTDNHGNEDSEIEFYDDSDPGYSPDFEECFESDHIIDNESDDDIKNGRKKVKRKKSSVVQQPKGDENKSSVKDDMNSKPNLKSGNSLLATSSGNFTEENMIKVNLVQIVDKNGEKKLQMVLTKCDCHGNSDDTRTISHTQTNHIAIPVKNSPPKPCTVDNKNTSVTLHPQKTKNEIPVTELSPVKSCSNENKYTKLISLLQKNQTGVPIRHSSTKPVSYNHKNIRMVSLLRKENSGDSPTKSKSIVNGNVEDNKSISLSNFKNGNKNMTNAPQNHVSGQKGDNSKQVIDPKSNGSVANVTHTKVNPENASSVSVWKQIMDIGSQVEIQDGDQSNLQADQIEPQEEGQAENQEECHMKQQVEQLVGIQEGCQMEQQIDCQLTEECQTESQVEGRVNTPKECPIESKLGQVEMQGVYQIEQQVVDQVDLQTGQLKPQLGGQLQLQEQHVELQIGSEMELHSGEQEKLQTVEMQTAEDQIEQQEENEINSQFENQFEMHTGDKEELQTVDQEGLQTSHKLELQAENRTVIPESGQLQLQEGYHSELQQAVGQIELLEKGQVQSQVTENDYNNGYDYNAVTVPNNSQFMFCEQNVCSQLTCAVDENNIIYTQDGNYVLINQDIINGYHNYEISDGAGIDGNIFKVLSLPEQIGIEIVNDRENEIIQFGSENDFVHNYCKKTPTKRISSQKKGRKNTGKSKNNVECNAGDFQNKTSEIISNGNHGNTESNKGKRKRNRYERKRKEKVKKAKLMSKQCEFCGEYFKSETKLDGHIARQHSEKRIWKCEICDRVYQRRKGLKIHVQTHSREPTHECSICAKKCFTLWRLKVHLQTHEKTKVFQCKHCDKTFKSPSSHKDHEIRHETSHADLYVIPCKSCDKKFQNDKKLKLHIQRAHTKEVKKFKCDFCEKSFPFQGNLDAHLRTHTKEKPFQCKFCTKSFTLKCTLKEHENRHQGIKNFACDECDMSFVNKGSLRVHKLSHSDIKKYQCDMCGLSLKTKTNLNVHMRIHSGEKPYPCTECSKSFRTKFVLKKHMRSHTGEKLLPKFPCDICGKLFVTSYNRKIHRKTHTGDKTFFCESCGQKFPSQAFLNSHRKKCDESNIRVSKKSARISKQTAVIENSTP